MTKKLSKILKLAAVSVLSMGLLAGCGDAKDASSADVNASAATQNTEVPAINTLDKDTIVMGTNAAFPPFEYYENGEVVGFDPDFVQLVCDKLGKKLVIEDMDFDTLIIALNQGKIDLVAAGMTNTEKRAQQVDFSDDYFETTQLIIVKKDNEEIKTPDDLKGKKIGVQAGTTGELYVTGTEGIDENDVASYKTAPQAVMDLANGKIDAVVIDQAPAKAMVEQNSDVKVLDEEFTNEFYAIAVRKGDSELLKAINETLAEMKENGKYDELMQKYFPADDAKAEGETSEATPEATPVATDDAA